MDPGAIVYAMTSHVKAENPATPPRKKQKRNKPTLSCEECVERKTKVRRPRAARATSASARLIASLALTAPSDALAGRLNADNRSATVAGLSVSRVANVSRYASTPKSQTSLHLPSK
jgi:hypothetical protein